MFDQFLGTALLLACVCAITDKRNMKVSKQLVPLYVGFTVLGLGICFGYNCGYAVNPARDLAPRIFTALAGWGPGVFTTYSMWWVVPVLACHLGALAGAWLYYLAVELQWADGEEEADDMFEDEARDTVDTVDEHEYSTLPAKYDSQEEQKLNIDKNG